MAGAHSRGAVSRVGLLAIGAARPTNQNHTQSHTAKLGERWRGIANVANLGRASEIHIEHQYGKLTARLLAQESWMSLQIFSVSALQNCVDETNILIDSRPGQLGL